MGVKIDQKNLLFLAEEDSVHISTMNFLQFIFNLDSYERQAYAFSVFLVPL